MAMEKMTMPQLGESVTEGTIERWLVKPGDHIAKYDPIAEVQTDKVSAEVPSSFTGVVKELLAKEGETLSVGEAIVMVEVASSTPVASEAAQQPTNAPSQPNNTSKEVSTPGGNKARYSPAVLKLSQEHNVDLTQVIGSGKEGRITRKDILAYIESPNRPTAVETVREEVPVTQTAAPVSSESKPTTAPVYVPVGKGDKEIPVTGVRKAIAQNMVRAKQEVPHAWMMMEVDVTNLVSYRNSVKNQFKEKEGFNLTFFAFFVKAVAQALTEFPEVNSMWAGDKIVQKKDINISIAVATDDALFVPVIKHADEKTIKGIAREIADLAAKVRSGKLGSEDMKDGTFTVNNTGSFGSVQSMGIINYPQAAILQVESIVKRPVVMDHGMIGVRDMVNLCLSLDHRVLDGLVCGRFLQRVKEILENTSKETTPLY